MKTRQFQPHARSVKNIVKCEKLAKNLVNYELVKSQHEKLVKNLIQDSNSQTHRFWTSQLLLKSAKVFYR